MATETAGPVLLRDAENKHIHFVLNGRRRRIVHPEVVKELRARFPHMPTKDVGADVVAGLAPGALVPRSWTDEDWIEPPQNKQKMREIIVSRLSGKGVEFGAGSRPLPLPVVADVDYAEPFQSSEQYARMGYTDNTVVAKYKNPIENQHEIKDGSLDFLVAAHVIEHTPNPIGAIVESYRKLKPGGNLVLVVPDKRRTFDKKRETTSLEHMMLDFEKPDRARDFENYLDFYRNAKQLPDPEAAARKAHADGMDIHYHVWTPGTFLRMMTHIMEKLAPFRSVEVKPPVADDTCLEFYMVARR
jgi:SAM-dependent methyltransferase